MTKFIARKIGAEQEAVEEVFSETVLAALNGWHTFKHKSSYFTWLCRIALNKIADYYRDQVHERSIIVVPTLKEFANLESKEISPEERLALSELRKSVNDCLNLLPPEKRRLLHLRYWREFATREIAKTLGVSVRAAEGKLYRARQSFAKVASSHNLSPIPTKENLCV